MPIKNLTIERCDDHYILKSSDLGRPPVKIDHPEISKGICRIYCYNYGVHDTCHPSIDSTGSVKGMIKRGLWSKDDLVVTHKGFKYNLSKVHIGESVVAKLCHLIETGRVDLKHLESLPDGVGFDLSLYLMSYQELMNQYLDCQRKLSLQK